MEEQQLIDLFESFMVVTVAYPKKIARWVAESKQGEVGRQHRQKHELDMPL